MRIAVFIDGSNFYSKLKDLNIRNTSRFDYWSFIQSVSRKVIPVYAGYYVGQIRKEQNNPKSEILYANQQRLFAYLASGIPGVQIILGHIQNFQGFYREKGVDVRLALDLYKLAHEDVYDKAILMSSDSDLLPAVRMVQAIGKTVEYIGFAHNPSLALLKECDAKRLVHYEDLNSFEFKGQ